MSVAPAQLSRISGILLSMAPGADPLAALRSECKDLFVSRCDAEDMRGETPFRRFPAFDLFLVDAQSHCWRLVAEPAEASCVVVATRG